MIITITYNINIKSSNRQSAFDVLKNAGLKPKFTSEINSKTVWLTVDVENGSPSHHLANKYLFDSQFNKAN